MSLSLTPTSGKGGGLVLWAIVGFNQCTKFQYPWGHSQPQVPPQVPSLLTLSSLFCCLFYPCPGLPCPCPGLSCLCPCLVSPVGCPCPGLSCLCPGLSCLCPGLSCPCPVPILSLSWSVRSLSRLCSGLPCLCPAPCLTLSLASGSRLSGRLGRSESLRVSDRRRPSRGSLGAKGRGGGRSRSDVDMDPSSATAVLGPARRATYVTPLIS